MASLKSKLILSIIRNRHLLSGKLKREVIDENFSVTKFREKIRKASTGMKVSDSFTVEPVDLYGLSGEIISLKRCPPDKIILYIHGGGFISGSCLTHRQHVSKIVDASGIKALLFDYALAPEHPFPHGLNDCIKAYQWLSGQGYKSENIVVAGESAGGTLTLSFLLALKEQQKPQPKAAVSISAVTDLRCQAPSFEKNYKKDLAPYNSWNIWTKYYIRDADPKDPLLSPLFGDFKDVCPIMLIVGTNEIHLDDMRNIKEKCAAGGVDISYREYPDMVHAFPLLSPLFKEAKMAMDDIGTYIRDKLQ